MKINYYQTPEPDLPDSYTNPFFGISGGIARYDARTLKLADGDPVTSWEDSSRQQGAATQGIIAPTYQSGPIPGVFLADSGNSFMNLPPEITRDPRDGYTTVVFTARPEVNGQRHVVSFGIGDPTATWHVTAQYSLQYLRILAGGASGIAEPKTSPPTPVVITTVWRASGVSCWVDGELALNNVAYHAGYQPSLGPGRLGYYWGASVHDYVFFDHALDPYELAQVHAGMAKSWGL